MTAEDRLKEILREESRTLQPAGDGLAVIRERVARRRRLRLLLVPAGAVATAAVVVAVVALVSPGRQAAPGPANHGPTTPPAVRADSYVGPAIWPFTSDADARAWEQDPGERAWASSEQQVAQRFARDVLHLEQVTAVPDQDRMSLRQGGVEVGVARLAHREHGPWTVRSVDGGDLTVTAPTPGAAVVSPTTVVGRISGVHQNVQLQLVTTDGRRLAEAGAPAGQEVPWQGTLSWTDADWSTGGIIGVTRSDRDGSVTRVVAVPVTRSPTRPDRTFVGLVQGKVLLFDSGDGERLSQLTYPPSGSQDTAASWADGTLAWVRSKQSGCGDAVYRKTGDQITTVVGAGSYRVSSVQLSPSASVLARVQTPCGGGAPRLFLDKAAAPTSTVALPAGAQTRVLDVDDQGALLLLTGAPSPLIQLLPAGATDLSQARTLAPGTYGSPARPCEWNAAAFDGARLLAAESCPDRVRFVQLDRTGKRLSAGHRLMADTVVSTITIRQGVVVVEWFDPYSEGSSTVGRYRAGGDLLPYPAPQTCVSEVGGCWGAPDW